MSIVQSTVQMNWMNCCSLNCDALSISWPKKKKKNLEVSSKSLHTNTVIILLCTLFTFAGNNISDKYISKRYDN